ncbi:MAG: ABC transporter permease [Chloroflexi bacterium]|nr:ABC transporter permease [Chloroflexota bacterium]
MHKYAIRKLIYMLPVLVLVSLMIFSLPRLLPGDTVISMLGEVGTVGLGHTDLDKFRKVLGLDRPFFVQYGSWLWGALHGDMGKSLWKPETVVHRILDALPISAELMVLSLLISFSAGIPLGVISAVRRNSVVDYLARFVSLFAMSVPVFWTGIVLIFILSVYFHWLPPISYVSIFEDPVKNLKTFSLPALVLGYILTAEIARFTRSSLLEVIRQDYVRTAWAKGLRERQVIVRHALKNALIPVVTLSGITAGRLLGGTVVIEHIFSLPGMGRLTLWAIQFRDYPQIQGNLMFLSTVIMIANLLTDLTYGWLDPRIRYQ